MGVKCEFLMRNRKWRFRWWLRYTILSLKSTCNGTIEKRRLVFPTNAQEIYADRLHFGWRVDALSEPTTEKLIRKLYWTDCVHIKFIIRQHRPENVWTYLNVTSTRRFGLGLICCKMFSPSQIIDGQHVAIEHQRSHLASTTMKE